MTVRILLVDDDAVDRKKVVRAIGRSTLGAQVVEAADAAAALRACAESPFDCLLLDYNLPDMDGLALMARLCRTEGETGPAVVVLTGAGNERIAVEAMKRGAHDYLVKDSLGGDSLVRAVANALDKARLQRELQAARRQLEHLALYDGLTGLANRHLFTKQLQHAISLAHRNGGPVCLLIMDLNGFKQLNDRYGHQAGDAALEITGRRIGAATRDADTCARIGGDEFAVLMQSGASLEGAATTAERILASVNEPFPLEGRECRLGISIGIAQLPEHATGADGLMRCADSAMYEAKRAGGGYALFGGPGAKRLPQPPKRAALRPPAAGNS